MFEFIKNFEIELREAKELMNKTKFEFCEESKALAEEFKTQLNSYLIEGAIISGGSISSSWKDINEIIFSCTIGFPDYNKKYPGALDFGSDFYFSFEEGKIKANVGTCGAYGLEDVYQVKRIAVLNNLMVVNGKIIEETFSKINLDNYFEKMRLANEAERAYKDVERKINAFKIKEVENFLKVNFKFSYTKEVNLFDRISEKSRFSFWKKDHFIISKVTNKFIEVRIENESSEINYIDKIRKELVIDKFIKGVLKPNYEM